MAISPPQLAGLALLALLMLLIGWIALRKQPRAIKLFALALCVVGSDRLWNRRRGRPCGDGRYAGGESGGDLATELTET